MPSIGERVRDRRTELGWTQEVLAQRAGVSKSFLSDLENNRRSVGAETLYSIARALTVSVDFLMTGDPGVQEPKPKQERIPASLSEFASAASLTFRQVMALLDMQRQIIAHRSRSRDEDLEKVDWRKFYERVKEFL